MDREHGADETRDERLAEESDWDGGLRAAFGGAPVEGPPSVLERIEERFGRVSRVFLSDAHGAEGDEGPIVNATTGAGLEGTGRYKTLGEIARGGVGVVLQGHDANLGRDVAVKVLRARHQNNHELVQRFIEEAQIGGQLQHPGIVPVYDLGVDGARRPFFTMKLVRGRTLAALMADVETPAVRRGRLLGIFETVCQTIAYAHSRGVIHRDLKPANVMVGAFGEVQVMDWGFAKVLSRGGVDDERKSVARAQRSDVATVRSGPEGTQSFAGSVYGTPAYMPPEQANGGVDELDERADVFALGAILCEMLTGKPPYVPEPGGDVLADAAGAKLDAAMARLDASDAHRELVALARQCLSPKPADRPRNAGAVSKVISAQIASAEARATEARVEAAEARVRVAQERKSKRLSIALAVAICTLLIAAGVGWYSVERSKRIAREQTAEDVTGALRQVQAAIESSAWGEAKASLGRARATLAAGAASPALESRVEDVARSYHARLDAANMVDRLRAIRLMTDTRTNAVDQAYLRVFADLRWNPVTEPAPRDLADRVHPTARQSLAMALDDWAIRRLGRRQWPEARVEGESSRSAGNEVSITRLVEAAIALDPDPGREALRRAAAKFDAEKLLELVDGAEKRAPASIDLLGVALAAAGELDRAIAVLEAGYRAHPNAFWINIHLSRLYQEGEENRTDEALRHAMIALSLEPDSAAASLEMALVHAARGENSQAESYLAQAQDLDQKGEQAWAGVMSSARRKGIATRQRIWRFSARLRHQRGRPPPHRGPRRRSYGPESVRIAERHAREKPGDPFAQLELGETLMRASDFDGAILAFERAIRLDASLDVAHAFLADALREVAQYDRALAALEAAAKLGYHSSQNRRLEQRIKEDAALARRLAAGDPEVPTGLRSARIHRQAGRYASAARDYAAVLAGKADVWAYDVRRVTFEALCCAVLAGVGRGEEAAALSPAQRDAWRSVARDWTTQRLLRVKSPSRASRRRLYRLLFSKWFIDKRLDPVRPATLDASLPDAEAWRTLWRRIDEATGRR